MVTKEPMDLILTMTVSPLLVVAAWALARALPAQNVALIIGSLVASEWVVQAVGPMPGAPWRDLLFWPAIILWARIAGRWFLRRSRQDWNYGVWLIALAGAATALVQFAVALSEGPWSVACKRSGFRFVEVAFCLFWLSPWFISKLPQQPQQRAQ
jgi:hypothetical protein